jgi:hypothetical protein
MRRFGRLLTLSLPLLLAFALYGYTLRLPFFMDDGILFGLVREGLSSTNGFRFWGGVPPSGFYFPYYRPLVFTLWEWQGLLSEGRYDPLVQHLVNVWLYGLLGSGAAVLARRFTRHTGIGVLTGLGLVLYPLHYNAATWVASQFHLFAVLGMVLSVYFALIAVDQRHKGAFSALALCAAMGAFSHENAVLTPLLVGFALLFRYRLRVFRLSWAWAAGIISAGIAGLYFYLYSTLPGIVRSGEILWTDAPKNLGLFLQSQFYPTAVLLHRLNPELPASDELFFALAGGTTLPLLAWLVWRARERLPQVGYAALWFLGAAIPTLFLLPYDYVRGSWRLLLVASFGGALFWAVLLVSLWNSTPSPLVGEGAGGEGRFRVLKWLPRSVALALALWSIFVSVDFLAQRQREALLQGDYLYALQAQVEQHALNGQPILINAPTYLTPLPHNTHFFTGGMGVIFVADFVNYNLLIEAETGAPFPYVTTLIFPETFAPPLSLGYTPFSNTRDDFTTKLRQASAVFVTVFEGEMFYPLYVGSPNVDLTDVAPVATFPAAGVSLLEGMQTELLNPTRLQVTTHWRVATAKSVIPRLRVYCGAELVGDSAQSIWGGTHPFRVWQTDEAQADVRTIRLYRPVEASCLSVTIGVVDETEHGLEFAPAGEVVRVKVE